MLFLFAKVYFYLFQSIKNKYLPFFCFLPQSSQRIPKGRRVSLRSLRLKRIRWDTTALPYLLNKLGYSLII